MGFRDWLDSLLNRDAPRRGGRSAAPGGRAARARPDRAAETTRLPPQPAAPPTRPPEAPITPTPAPAPAPAPAVATPPPVAPAPIATPAAPAPAPAAPPRTIPPTRVHKAPRFSVLAVLVGLAGQEQARIYAVRDAPCKLGRDPSCNVVFQPDSDSISGQHAKIIHNNGVFGIMSLKETSPCEVNGKPVGTDGAKLSDDDVLLLGDSSFRFRTIKGL